MDSASPARLYCALVGAALVIAGILGFFYESSFDTGNSIRSDDVFGILAVNGWHNLAHLGIGLVLIVCASRLARQASLAVGLLYIVLAVWGFLVTEDGVGDILGLLPVNTEDNLLHLVLGLTGCAAGAATPAAPARERPRRTPPSEPEAA